MTKEVNFKFEKTVETRITIYDEQGEEIEDSELFEDIIDDYGSAYEYEGEFQTIYQENAYTVVVESAKEDSMYIGFEVY